MAKPRMTDAEVMAALRSDSILNKARAAFSSGYGEIDQAGRQRTRPTMVEIRRLEFETVERIAEILGVEIDRT